MEASYDKAKVGKFAVRGRDARGVVYLSLKGAWTTVFGEAAWYSREEVTRPASTFRLAGYAVEIVGYLDALCGTRAGCVRLWKPRGSDVVVGVYRGDEAGMDTDNGDSPWSLVCEDHAYILAFSSRKAAESHGVVPREWCEYCNGNEPVEDTGVGFVPRRMST